MKLFSTGWYQGLRTNKNKSQGYILLPEVLIAMLVVAFCMSQLWQSVFGVMNFGAKIEKDFSFNNEFSKICTKVLASESAFSLLFDKKQQLESAIDDNKKNNFMVFAEFSNKNSDLSKIAGSRFAYLCVKNNNNHILKMPIFLGAEEKDSKYSPSGPLDKIKDSNENFGGK